MTLPRPGDMVVTRWGARFLGRRFPCSVGRSGILAVKAEGDGATPAGVLRLVGSGYRADRVRAPHAPFPVTAMRLGDIWSDDSRDPDYNHGLHAPTHPFSHERMWRGDRLYDLVVMTDHNWPNAQPGAGSAIFLHRWRKPRHPTEGCVAFRPADLRWIVEHWGARSRLIIRGQGCG